LVIFRGRRAWHGSPQAGHGVQARRGGTEELATTRRFQLSASRLTGYEARGFDKRMREAIAIASRIDTAADQAPR
jgi:hypothetical protein